MRPVIREEEFVANYYEPFGETFVSTARPPVRIDLQPEEDEGADFYNEFIMKTRKETEDFNTESTKKAPLPPPPPPSNMSSPPPKLSVMGNLFGSMDIDNDVDASDGWDEISA